jgi:mannose-6-phosphate isomerase-like protein (cupin superfamily)
MPTEITSTETAEHYTWGGLQGTDCDGWHLVKTTDLSIIEELMPSGTREERHFHAKARQFFFVLEGELSMELEHHDYLLLAGQGLEIAPGQQHRAMNKSNQPMRMVVTSQPSSHGDRFPA